MCFMQSQYFIYVMKNSTRILITASERSRHPR